MKPTAHRDSDTIRTSPSNERYRIVPQMRTYDRIPRVLAPYLTTTTKPLFRSEVVNTDSLGFRVSLKGDQIVDTETWWGTAYRGIVLGGSSVFGVGATHDRHTMVSALNSSTEYSFLNLGLRAGNSTQELIAAIPFLAQSEYVIVCSGINNLLASLQSGGANDLYGPLFGEEVIGVMSAYSIHELRQMVDSSLRGVRLKTLVREIVRRVRTRATSFRRLRRSRVRTRKLDNDQDLANRGSMEVAVGRQIRDLSIIAGSIPDRSRLLFVAQPFAALARVDLCREEEELFKLADAMQGQHWQFMKSLLVELWPAYVGELEKECSQNGIMFMDLNRSDISGWAYVDRVHMTDAGYRQVAESITSVIA